MLRQHFDQALKSLENPEVVRVFSARSSSHQPPIKKTVARAVVSPQPRTPTSSSPRSSKAFTIVTSGSPTASPTRLVHKFASETMPAPPSSRTSQQSAAKKVGSDYQRVPSAQRPSSKQSARGPSAVNRDDLTSCRYCSRRFATDRLATHEDICAKTMKKKRKTYDATKHRVQGTELEPYTRKSNRTASVKPANQPDAGNQTSKNSKQLANQPDVGKNLSKQPKQSKQSPSGKKSDWRRKHEEFISAIRAAKTAQAHVAAGGKLSDLPPPPPSSNPDYVQCPHCGRKFNESAAQRHIPKCATYDFNKTKQPPRVSGPRNSKTNPSFR